MNILASKLLSKDYEMNLEFSLRELQLHLAYWSLFGSLEQMAAFNAKNIRWRTNNLRAQNPRDGLGC